MPLAGDTRYTSVSVAVGLTSWSGMVNEKLRLSEATETEAEPVPPVPSTMWCVLVGATVTMVPGL